MTLKFTFTAERRGEIVSHRRYVVRATKPLKAVQKFTRERQRKKWLRHPG